MADLYAILQVQPTAHPDVVAAAYRALARRYHPDTGGDERAMMALNRAWDVLRDPARRAAYDAACRAAQAGPSRHAPEPPAATRPDAGPETGTPAATPQAEPRRRPADPSILDFGRYEGNTIAQVARVDPDYLLWLQRTPIGRRFERQITELLATRESAPTRAPSRQTRRWAAVDSRR